ncbi:MAG: putative ABC transporter permease [Oscillospiraceae bacterium]|nr:putative ABC transporter permease [Oscillospiraceae bacterium]
MIAIRREPARRTGTEFEFRPAERAGHFAYGFNFYKIFWMFALGSVTGFLTETISCLVRFGLYEYRSSLILSPFNLIYGVGAIAVSLGVTALRAKRAPYIFVAGMVIGSVVEFVCSLFEETFFGTVSWDYSAYPFNLDGRVCLQYAFFWGAMALLWTWVVYPFYDRLLKRFSDAAGRTFAVVLLLVLLLDAAFSVTAVNRWIDRAVDTHPETAIERVLDKYLPDERMALIYPHMKQAAWRTGVHRLDAP